MQPWLPRRWVLWGLLFLLVSLLLSALVFLAREYEDNLAQNRLDQTASNINSEIRNGLLRNVQNLLALHNNQTAPGTWETGATEVLGPHREMVQIEWRDSQLKLLAHRISPYQPGLFAVMPREQALPDIRQACMNAQRSNSPSYASSYFWPMSYGLGMELMEMCMPVAHEGEPRGYLVVTYSLAGVLSELVGPDLRRSSSLAITESDGTRLSIVGAVHSGAGVMTAQQLVDLPGAAFMLRVERAREFGGWLPHVLTVTVGTLSLALLAVLGLFARDIGKRLRAEGRLADALAFRKAMEDSLVTGLRARDMDGRVTYVNPAFCQMVGFSAEQLIGTGLPAPWWPPELVNEYQQRQAVRLAGQALPREGWESVFQRSDGTRFPVLIFEAPLIDARGVQTGWMSAILDLTEQRRVEELSRASQERLQATARLAMAGEMASLIGHELNQPLAAIASYASGISNLMQETEGTQALPEPLRSDIAEAIGRMKTQAERAGKVIKSVSDLVRRREHAREAMTPQALFDAVTPLLQLQARKLNIDLRLEVASNIPAVWCDSTMVEQVLLNLARNGMQAMPLNAPPSDSGLRQLTLRARLPTLTNSGRTWVEFSVTDHGQGLSPEVIERLFTPFFTTKAEGMGLGLNLCRTVIEQHGGVLVHEHALPFGTVFRFTLPSAR
jgi:two-component system, LuxR family, sensor histidine kinase DctS